MYACTDPGISSGCSFQIYTAAAATADLDTVAGDLERHDGDVYAFSCYLWNMGLVRRLLYRLLPRLPDAEFILGGPQVMNHAASYVSADRSNVVVCNGEGERTFQHYLRQLLGGHADFAAVPGLSFWRDGELVTTARPERIGDLTEIPSPFTAGLFEKGRYNFATLETNRGCPFNCGFCFWGAATNAKVNKFETQRVIDDITWISENKFATIFLADANWGMAPRDVDFTRHMVECNKRTGYPMIISINSAKNKPDRMADITRILVGGGLLTSQPISLQTLNPQALELVDRTNIRPETYTSLQQTLRDEAISSHIEMIWPLPGETTTSFRHGITELCRSGADTILIYPQLLLHNTPIYADREKLGIQVRRVPDEVSEADIVVGTNWVSQQDYEEGVWLCYAVQSLHNMRGLYYLASYLDRDHALAFGDVFATAAAYFRSHQESAVARFMSDSVRDLSNYYLLNAGLLAHMILHTHRGEFDALLADFVATQPFWDDSTARAAFELDLLARPYFYRQRPRIPDYPFTYLRAEPRGDDGWEVTIPEQLAGLVAKLSLAGRPPAGPLLLRHSRRRKLPYMKGKTLDENLSYCQGMMLHLREVLPDWTPLQAVPG
jgi:putative methyltransferase